MNILKSTLQLLIVGASARAATAAAEEEHYYYVAYYQDSECTEPVGIRAFRSGETAVLPVLTDRVSCYDAMACVYDPEGELCESRRLGDEVGNFTQFVDPSRHEVVSSCEGTLATLQGGCVETKPTDCVQSGLFPVDPCKFRVVSALYLSENPQVLSVSGTDPTKGEDEASGQARVGVWGAAMAAVGLSSLLWN